MIASVKRISIKTRDSTRVFVFNFSSEVVTCAYSDKKCSPNCASCVIKEYQKCYDEANCIRGEFTIGYVNIA